MNTMEYVEATLTEQNSLGLLEAIRQAFGGANNPMEMSATSAQDVYEIRPREDRDGFDLISDRLRYGPIWYAGPDAVRCAVAYAKYRSHSRSHRAIIRVFDESGRDRDPRISRRFSRAVTDLTYLVAKWFSVNLSTSRTIFCRHFSKPSPIIS